ncbi:YCF48-related protein [Flagellimonas sp.]|uniref:YCF48-related protein n=1 Tax=Flagellimonas sp. TaxID=2058762 RepID=UPI003B51B925
MLKKLHFCLFSTLLCLFSNAQQSWETLNPKPSFLPGWDIHFVSDTEGFYITSNELFHTINSGEKWELKAQLSGATDMAFNGATGAIVGNSGYVLKTEDSGSTWSTKNIGIAEPLNTITILDPDNLIASSNNSIFLSSNGGDTWIQKNIPDGRINKTFFVNATVGHAVSDNGQIFKTVDGGDNWYITADFTNVAPNSFFTVHFKSESIGYATREHSQLYKTIDGGETWQEMNRLTEPILEFQFIDDNIGFGAGEYGVLKTTDGGDNWSRIGVDLARIEYTDMYGVYFFDENRGFAVGQRGRIAMTEDSGENWELYAPINGVGQIEFLPNNNGIISVGTEFFESSNNGQDWEYLGTPSVGNYLGEFDFIGDNVGFCIVDVSTGADEVYKTVDGGKTWVKPENVGLYFDYGAYSFDFVNENLGFASGGFNTRRTYKTTDGGEIWRVVLLESLGQIQFLNESIGYGRRVGSAIPNVIFKTTDGGENWSQNFVIEEEIGDFYFLDAQTGYAVGDDGFGIKTVNGGDSWETLELPYRDFEFVKFFNYNIGYIADDYGALYKTENGGRTWEWIFSLSGLNDININNQEEVFITGSYGKILKSQVTYQEVGVTVGAPTDITAISVNIPCVFASNSEALTNLRLEYGENGSLDNVIEFNGTVQSGRNEDFIASINGLEAATTYDYRAVAVKQGEVYYSELKTFTTPENFRLTISPVYNYSAESAVVSVQTLTNNEPLSQISFEYGMDENSLEESVPASPSTVTINDGTVNVQATLESLNAESQYFVRARAEYNGEVVYSGITNFTTRPEFNVNYFIPNISGSDVTLRANISAYKDNLTEIVFEYGPENFLNQQEGTPNIIEINRTGYVSTTIEGLTPDNIYYYRIKAKLGEKVVNGPEAIFSLSENTVLLNDQIKEIGRESVLVTGRVFSNTGILRNIQIEYGVDNQFDHSTFATPSASGSGSTIAIEGLLTGLLSETQYNYRLKGTDSNGIDHYSEVSSFTTLEPLPANNFRITSTDETCPDKANGTLLIEALITSEYNLYLEDELYTFSKDFMLENMQAGTYSIRILEVGGSSTYLYEFTILQSKGLEAKTTTIVEGTGKRINVLVDKGSFPFTVAVNDEKLGEFNTNSFSFHANNGDKVKISSKYDCEGSYTIDVGGELVQDSYVNPIETEAVFFIHENNEMISVQLLNVQGMLLESFKAKVQNNSISVDFKNYPSGVYFIKLLGLSERTHKILKR